MFNGYIYLSLFFTNGSVRYQLIDSVKSIPLDFDLLFSRCS